MSYGLCYLPITEPKSLINIITKTGKKDQITLRVTVAKSDTEFACKLHRFLAYPSADKLLKLVKNAGGQWEKNKELQDEIINITEKCQVCKIYKKPPPTSSYFLTYGKPFPRNHCHWPQNMSWWKHSPLDWSMHLAICCYIHPKYYKGKPSSNTFFAYG